MKAFHELRLFLFEASRQSNIAAGSSKMPGVRQWDPHASNEPQSAVIGHANADALAARPNSRALYRSRGPETSVPTPRPVASTAAVELPDTIGPTFEDAGEEGVSAFRLCTRKGAEPGRTFGWRGVFMLTSDSRVREIAGDNRSRRSPIP
jgi:hypothetical protein